MIRIFTIPSLGLLLLNLKLSDGFTVGLTHNGPAVLGAPLTYTAVISEYEPSALISYEVRWTDDDYRIIELTPAARIDWNVTYNKPGKKKSYITVRKILVEIPIDSAKNATAVNIVSTIPGSLKVEQKGLSEHRNFVSTTSQTNITFVIHDPNGFFNNVSMSYFWTMSPNTPPYQVLGDKLIANFTDASTRYLVILSVFAFKDGPAGSRMYEGSYNVEIIPKDPIVQLNITGQTWLKRGDLLNLGVSCSGSPPYSYCRKFQTGDVNTSQETCTNPIVTSDCNFYIIHYFSKVGNYKVITIIDNDVDHRVNVTDVNIYDVTKQPQLSVIVLPIVCNVLVLAIIVYGIGFYLHSRRRFSVEVADFDFQTSDSYEYRTFFGQIKAEILEALGKGRGPSASGSSINTTGEY